MTQLSLLTRIPLSLPEARRRRDVGVARSDRSLAFAAEADAAILRLARTRAEFIVDDVWCEMPTSPTGVDNRAMGAAMQRAAKAGIILASDRYRPSSQPQCHANPRRIWLSRRVSR